MTQEELAIQETAARVWLTVRSEDGVPFGSNLHGLRIGSSDTRKSQFTRFLCTWSSKSNRLIPALSDGMTPAASLDADFLFHRAVVSAGEGFEGLERILLG